MDIELNPATNLPKTAALHWLIRRTIRAAGMSLALGALAPAFAQLAPAPAASATDPPQSAAAAQLQEVVVTGTMIRATQAPVGASLTTIGQTQIAETGAQTVQQVLENSPLITGFGSPAQGSQGSFDNAGTYEIGRASCRERV